MMNAGGVRASVASTARAHCTGAMGLTQRAGATELQNHALPNTEPAFNNCTRIKICG